MSNNPDRWSKASSDSDASFFSTPGEIRLDLPRALDVKELLFEKAAFVTGGKDLNGGIVVTIPKYTEVDDITFAEQFSHLLDYLASTRSVEEKAFGFSFLVDLRRATWGEIRPVMKLIQDCFRFKVNNAYVLKPDGFGGIQRASFSATKFTFEIILTSIDGIVKYISPLQLTKEYGGQLNYEHFVWVKMRTVSDNYDANPNPSAVCASPR
eukprot:gene17297-19028_t